MCGYGGGAGHYSKYTQQVSFREPGRTHTRTHKPKPICSPLFQSWGYKKYCIFPLKIVNVYSRKNALYCTVVFNNMIMYFHCFTDLHVASIALGKY